MEQNGLIIKDLNFSYDDFNINALNLELPKGCVMGLIGENGAGKSTLINLICRRIFTGEETISFNGMNDFRSDLAFIFDELKLSKSYRVKDVGRLMRYAYKAWDQSRFEEYCGNYGLQMKDKVSKMSLGMKQRLMQAAALSHSAKIFVFDEPSDGIDPFIRTQLLNDLRNVVYEEDVTVLISSHNVSELEDIVDYIAYMEKGTILFQCDIETFRDEAISLLEQFRVRDISTYESNPSLQTFTALMQTRYIR